MKKRIVVIGASDLQLPLILKAKELGIETHVFAWQAGAVAAPYCDFFYPISIVDREAILDKARKIKPDGVTSIASDLATVTVNYLAHNLGLVGNEMAIIPHTTNKYLMRKRLSGGGLPCPRFLRADSSTRVQDIPWTYPIIVKPADRSGSRGVTKVCDPAQFPRALADAIAESFAKEAVVEEFIEGREISVEMISCKGEHNFLTITDKETTGAPHFVETAHHQPAMLSTALRARIVDVVKKALTCLGVTSSASHSELLITADERIYIVEIGARMGGDHIGSDLVFLSTGYDFVKGVIDLALGSPLTVSKPLNKCAGIYYVTPPPGKIVSLVDRTHDFPEIVHKKIMAEVGDTIRALRQSADRIAYYIYQADDRFLPDRPPIEVITEHR